MERRRPNRELTNSEDVQDALIEDNFRYDDLSIIQAEAISMINVYSRSRSRDRERERERAQLTVVSNLDSLKKIVSTSFLTIFDS